MDQETDAATRAAWRPPAEEVPQAAGPRWARAVAATVLSLVLPGAGQLLNRTWARAAIIFVIWVAAWITHLRPIWIVMVFFAGGEAGWTAARRRRPTAPSPAASGGGTPDAP